VSVRVYAFPWRERADVSPETYFHALSPFLNSLLCQAVKQVCFYFWGEGGGSEACGHSTAFSRLKSVRCEYGIDRPLSA